MNIFSVVPPHVTLSPNKILHVPRGAEVKLLCSVKGYPKPHVSWLRNGRPFISSSISNTMDVSQLTLSEVDEDVKLSCVATNTHGKSTDSVDIHISGEPIMLPYFKPH